MSIFSLDWLRLRAPFDRAARNPALASRFAQVLRRPPDRPVRLLDLGAGTGANARALAPIIGGDQDWLLAESDPALLAFCAAEQIAWAAREGYGVEKEAGAVVIRAGSQRWRFTPRPVDLASDLARCLGDPYDGLAFSALADLASAAWVDGLAAQLERRRMPLLSSLMVDGRRQWQPPVAEDEFVRDAFAAHQRRDKGLGPALGSTAPVYLGARLAAAGFAVATAASDWQIGPDQTAMLAAVLEAERRAAGEERPEDAERIDRWAEERRAVIASGGLSLAIGHRDLLARPREM